MRYTKVIDIGAMTEQQIRQLQPGQWVYTGTDGPAWRGRFWGVKPSGTVVVAWQGNATKSGDWRHYQKQLRSYACA